MKTGNKVLIVLFFSFWSTLNAQDVQFSQFYAVPLYQNPAFAGSAHAARGIVHQRFQWLSLDANFRTFFASGDFYLPNQRSGIGFYALRDWQGGSTLNTTEIALLYSYELPVSSKYSIRMGLQGSANYRSLDYSQFRYPGEFTDSTGYQGSSGLGPNGQDTKLYPDVSTGGVFYGDNLWVGISAHHLNSPSQGFVAGTDNLPIKVAFTGGYKIPIAMRSRSMAYVGDEREFTITPTFHYKFQGKSDQLDLGLYFIYNQLLFGTWYRGLPIKKYEQGLANNESVIFNIGWRYKQWTAGYSYDLVVSQLTQARNGGAHEINLTYIHFVEKKHKPMRRLPCPSFYKH